MSVKNIFSAIGATLALAFTFLFGELNGLLIALFSVMVLDGVTGVLKDIYLEKLSSKTLWKGALHKFGMMVIIALSNILDNAFGLDGIARNIAIGYYVASEGVAILENWQELGLPLPKKLQQILLLETSSKRMNDTSNNQTDNK